MDNAVCLNCGQPTVLIIEGGERIRKNGFDYCQRCIGTSSHRKRPRYSRRYEEIEKNPKDFETDKRRIIDDGEDPSLVDHQYYRRHVLFVD